MGLDLQLRAFTEEPALLELAARSEAHGEEVAFLHRYLAPGPVAGPLAPPEVHQPFTELGARMAQRHPGIAGRCHDVGRAWDVLHYLLSPGRRAGQGIADDWGTWAIRGSDPVGALARGVQGIAIRYVPRARVDEVSRRLDDVRPEHLRAHWDPARMQQQAVYKLAASEETFDAHWAAFVDLRAFYRATRREREAVLVVLD